MAVTNPSGCARKCQLSNDPLHSAGVGGRSFLFASAAELCRYDDICTGMIVDPYLGFQTHKMNIKFRPLSNRSELKRIVVCFIENNDYNKTYNALLAADRRRVISFLRTQHERNLMRQHVYNFLKIFDKDAGFTIEPCRRYSLEKNQGAKIIATKFWKKGETLQLLVGCVGELAPREEKEMLVFGKNDFSVMYSVRKKKSLLWLGPAAYMNHDCRPNCLLYSGGCRTTYKAIRNITPGDEILLSYGCGFFGKNNCHCECATCEGEKQGTFRPDNSADQDSGLSSSLDTPAPDSRVLTRADLNMLRHSETWRSGTRELEVNTDFRSVNQLKQRQLTRYDAQIIIEASHHCYPVSSLTKPTSSTDVPVDDILVGDPPVFPSAEYADSSSFSTAQICVSQADSSLIQQPVRYNRCCRRVRNKRGQWLPVVTQISKRVCPRGGADITTPELYPGFLSALPPINDRCGVDVISSRAQCAQQDDREGVDNYVLKNTSTDTGCTAERESNYLSDDSFEANHNSPSQSTELTFPPFELQPPLLNQCILQDSSIQDMCSFSLHDKLDRHNGTTPHHREGSLYCVRQPCHTPTDGTTLAQPNSAKLRITLVHPDTDNLHTFNRQLELEGRSRFIDFQNRILQ